MTQAQKKYAIRFGLGALKAVGLNMMEVAITERKNNGNFKDIYDFASRIEPKSVNKKSIEALAKSGTFDCFNKHRAQFFESFDVLSAYAHQKKEEASSSQMSMFGELLGEERSKPQLKKTHDWSKEEKLQKEFEAFGFFLNEHPVDDYMLELKKRGVVFSDKIEKDEFEDGFLVKMAGVVAASKHRSSAKGRFAYLSISDPIGIFEVMVFDEVIITNARDIIVDGSSVVIECLVRKDEGGIRILVREVHKLIDFIKNVKAAPEVFEDIKKQRQRQNRENYTSRNNSGENVNYVASAKNQNTVDPYKERIERLEAKKIFARVEVVILKREAIFDLKVMMLKLIAPSSFAKSTKIILVVDIDGAKKNIVLPENYLLDEGDLVRMRSVAGVVEVNGFL